MQPTIYPTPEVIWQLGDPWRDLRAELEDAVWTTIVTENLSTMTVNSRARTLTRIPRPWARAIPTDRSPVRYTNLDVATPCGVVVNETVPFVGHASSGVRFVLAGRWPHWDNDAPESIRSTARSMLPGTARAFDDHQPRRCGARYCVSRSHSRRRPSTHWRTIVRTGQTNRAGSCAAANSEWYLLSHQRIEHIGWGDLSHLDLRALALEIPVGELLVITPSAATSVRDTTGNTSIRAGRESLAHEGALRKTALGALTNSLIHTAEFAITRNEVMCIDEHGYGPALAVLSGMPNVHTAGEGRTASSAKISILGREDFAERVDKTLD